MRTHPALLVAVGLAAAPTLAAAAGVGAGAYDNTLLIGYDPASGVISGYFDMDQPGPPDITCAFVLQGKLAAASVALQTFDPAEPKDDLITGKLTVTSKNKVRVTLASDHGGCGNVWPFADASNPSDFALQTARPWTSVRVVKADKAYFSPAPGAAHGRAYLVGYDGVGVLATKPGWVRAEYVGGKKPITGWLAQSDLYPGP